MLSERESGGRPWNRTKRASPRGSYSPLPHLAACRPLSLALRPWCEALITAPDRGRQQENLLQRASKHRIGSSLRKSGNQCDEKAQMGR